MKPKNLVLASFTPETKKLKACPAGNVMRVKKAIEYIQGIKRVDVSLENKQAVVEFDEGKTDVEKTKAAIKEAGYEPL